MGHRGDRGSGSTHAERSDGGTRNRTVQHLSHRPPIDRRIIITGTIPDWRETDRQRTINNTNVSSIMNGGHAMAANAHSLENEAKTRKEGESKCEKRLKRYQFRPRNCVNNELALQIMRF
eukprot:6111904-Pleurochrysis_carterae.AAC.6